MLDLNKIEQIARGVDEHLRKLETMIGLLRDIRHSLDEIRHSREDAYMYEIGRLRMTVADLTEQLGKRGLPKTNQYEQELAEIRRLIDGPDWPAATDPASICDGDEAKMRQRASLIIDLLVGEHMKGKRFLDYGCGHGHVVMAAKDRETATSVGYDIDLSKLSFSGPDFTDDFNVVKSMAPFDIVVLHDVLDHAVGMEPIGILYQIKSVLSPKGRVYVRCHPWSSRHGGHLYTSANKAFLHLSLDAVELVRVGGLVCETTVRVTSPLETYRCWFTEAGFRVCSAIPIRDPVEEFFLMPSVARDRIVKNFPDLQTAKENMEITFVEYVLEPDSQVF